MRNIESLDLINMYGKNNDICSSFLLVCLACRFMLGKYRNRDDLHDWNMELLGWGIVCLRESNMRLCRRRMLLRRRFWSRLLVKSEKWTFGFCSMFRFGFMRVRKTSNPQSWNLQSLAASLGLNFHNLRWHFHKYKRH